MQVVQTGKEKQIVYAHEYRRLKMALNEEFYLEAISIGYAVIEDRLIAFLHHAGIVSRQNGNLAINSSVLPFIRRVLEKKNGESIRVKDISVKISVIQKLLQLTEKEASEIDNEIKINAEKERQKKIAQKGYMVSLQKQITRTVDIAAVQDILKQLDPWRDERNQLIHALLSKTVSSSQEAQKNCAECGIKLTRMIDDELVKPFKKNNRIRKVFNIQ